MNVLEHAASKLADRAWLSTFFGAALVGAAGIAAGPWGWWALAPLGVGVALEAMTSWGVHVNKREDARAVEEYKMLLDAAIQPLVYSLFRLASHKTKRARTGELTGVLNSVMHGALYTAAGKGSGVRASIFHRIEEDGKDVLVPHPSFSTGRGDRPKSKFVRDEGEGKAVWEAAEADEVIFYPDIRAEAPEGMDTDRERAYCTFITAPIHANGELKGLLTINAPNPGDLRDEDTIMMRILATLAGNALVLCDGEWPVRGTT